MALTEANAATQILAKAFGGLGSLREQAKSSKDANLKENISKLYDDLLALKEVVIRVTDENAELKRAIARPAEVQPKPAPERRQVGAVYYYFQGEEGPFCQPCYIMRAKLVALDAAFGWSGGIRRQCPVCKEFFYEKPMVTPPCEVGGPHSWMG
jgi:hypothetical protein